MVHMCRHFAQVRSVLPREFSEVAERPRLGDRFAPSVDIEFPVERHGALLDRRGGDEQLAGDLLVGQPRGQQPEHFEFTAREGWFALDRDNALRPGGVGLGDLAERDGWRRGWTRRG